MSPPGSPSCPREVCPTCREVNALFYFGVIVRQWTIFIPPFLFGKKFALTELFSSTFLVFQRYKTYSPYDMQESIVKEVKGDLQKSFLVLGKYTWFYQQSIR